MREQVPMVTRCIQSRAIVTGACDSSHMGIRNQTKVVCDPSH